MIGYLLDTSVIIDLLREKEEVRNFLRSHQDDLISTSAICHAELAEGVYREQKEQVEIRKKQLRNLFSSFYDVFSFSSEEADVAGKIRAELSLKGKLIEDLDILIAATALTHNCILVTKNPRHFQRISGLKLLSV